MKLNQLEKKYPDVAIELAARGVEDREELALVLGAYDQKGGDVAAHVDSWIARLAERRLAHQERKAAATALQAEADRKRAEYAATCAAVIEKYGSTRCWRLQGLFLEEASTERYTYQELEAWRRWSAHVLRHAHPDVNVVCERPDGGDFHISWSGYFEDVFNDRPRRSMSFGKIAGHLRDWLADRQKS